MSRPLPPSDRRLIQAAQLRIEGLSWDAIASRFRRSPETVRKWPLEFAERWQLAVLAAERRLAVDSEAEAVIVLRNLLRDDEKKLRWHAARSLVHLRIELGKLDLRALAYTSHAAAPNKGGLLTELLEGYTDEQLVRLAATGFQHTAALPPGPAGTTPGRPA